MPCCYVSRSSPRTISRTQSSGTGWPSTPSQCETADAPPGKVELVGADASHAWFSVYAPDRGWLDFDPTNNQIPGERHITVATGRDYRDVSPLRGVTVGGASHSLKVSVDVAPL